MERNHADPGADCWQTSLKKLTTDTNTVMNSSQVQVAGEKTNEIYDPLFHTGHDDLYEIYAQLRETHPVYYNANRDVWCLTRFRDVQAAARDWKHLTNTPGVDLDSTGNLLGPGNFLDEDPPRHNALRDVVRPFFVPKAIAELRDEITRRVQSIVEDLAHRDTETVDLAQDFALRLPIGVISFLLGAPEADDALITELVIGAEAHEPGSSSPSERAIAAVARLREYLSDLAEYKRDHPDDKILSKLVAGADHGTPAQEEMFGMAAVLFVAGSETTFALLTNSLNILAANPDASLAIRNDATSDVVNPAIEEILRFEAPVQYLARTVREATTMHGVEIPANSRLILVWGSANRDPDRWDEPDTFDIHRRPQRNLAFGEGIHHCIGAPLARLEAQIAIPAFLRAFPEYEVGLKKRRYHHLVRGWERLDASLGSPPIVSRSR